MAVAGLVVLLGFVRVRVLRVAAPFALTAVVLACAVYAEVPFDRHSVQNRTLVRGPVADAVAAPAPAATAATAVAPMAVRRSKGALRGINHSASGDVSIIEAATGEFVVRFENFTVQGAPGPVLYVAHGADVRAPTGTKLGPFTATKGATLDVALPAGVEPGPGWTVLIWCERFATPIANAPQS